DRAEPEEEWGVGLTDIGTEVLPGLEEDILDDVGGVHPTLEPRVQPEAYHPAQPRSVPLHQLRPAPGVAGGGLLDKSLDIAGVGTHGDHHTTLIGARATLVTESVEKACSSRATTSSCGAVMMASACRKSPRLRLPPCLRRCFPRALSMRIRR